MSFTSILLTVVALATSQGVVPPAIQTSTAQPASISSAPQFVVGSRSESIKLSIPWTETSDDDTPRISEFAWAGANWQLLLFLNGVDSEFQSGYSSVYLRLVSDSRPLPLPRGLSFSFTATGESEEISQRCPGHVFSLDSSSKHSWGFSRFAERSTLERLALSTSSSQKAGGAATAPLLNLELRLGPSSSSSWSSTSDHTRAPTPLSEVLPAGLVNYGSTCYMNALLQSLYHVTAFREGLLSSVERGIASGQIKLSKHHSNAAVELSRTFLTLKRNAASAAAAAAPSSAPNIPPAPPPSPTSSTSLPAPQDDMKGAGGGLGKRIRRRLLSWPPWSPVPNDSSSSSSAPQPSASAPSPPPPKPGRTLGVCRSLGIDVRLQEDAQEFRGNLFAALSEALEGVSPLVSEEESKDDDEDTWEEEEEEEEGKKADGGALESETAKKKRRKKEAAAAKKRRRRRASAMAALEAPFQGHLLNEITSGVPEVPFSKTWREPFADLAVDVTLGKGSSSSGGSGEGVTLEQALEAYFGEEVMEGDNAYRAQGLGLLEKAFKRCRLDPTHPTPTPPHPPPPPSASSRVGLGDPLSCDSSTPSSSSTSSPPPPLPSGLPEVLHVQLKRFSFDASAMTLSKVHRPCHFPEMLDLGPFVASSSSSSSSSPFTSSPPNSSEGLVETRYRLHAVLIHSGDASFGHYYAYIKPNLAAEMLTTEEEEEEPHTLGWVKFDDTTVTPRIPTEHVLREGAGVVGSGRGGGAMMVRSSSTNAYLLQYIREDAVQALLHDGQPPNESEQQQ